ncbi:MAG: hypothetical protein M1376_10335 [Planctomycetes bacterium]|nr:hypothetical protein [Planctomycetota bacterium]
MSRRRNKRHRCNARHVYRGHGPHRASVTLAQFRETDAEAWRAFQAILSYWLDRNPKVVRFMSANGIGREATHEAAEKLIDSGLLRFFQSPQGFWFGMWDPIRRRYVPAGAMR